MLNYDDTTTAIRLPSDDIAVVSYSGHETEVVLWHALIFPFLLAVFLGFLFADRTIRLHDAEVRQVAIASA
jgi:predicted permease